MEWRQHGLSRNSCCCDLISHVVRQTKYQQAIKHCSSVFRLPYKQHNRQPENQIDAIPQ
ncbi:hypothetical protein [Kingella oralis]|uniref:hypothetical protein n=1 Tax=Kingella oralis TaxID=505 RepID=UPI0028E98471|nr:hypothetical protein [Kingella oralis]